LVYNLASNIYNKFVGNFRTLDVKKFQPDKVDGTNVIAYLSKAKKLETAYKKLKERQKKDAEVIEKHLETIASLNQELKQLKEKKDSEQEMAPEVPVEKID
jgi:mevalonate kinase